MKKKLLLLVLMLIIITSGCTSKKYETNDELKIENVSDYYISYYSSLLERRYKEAYAAYLYTHSSGNIESFKAQYEKTKEFYEFKDLNDDGIEEFIVVSESYDNIDDYLKIKYINIYTFDSETKKVSLYLSGEYWDGLYYNKSKDIYISKFNLDEQLKNKSVNGNENIDIFSIMEFYDYYKQLNRLEHYKDRDIFILFNENNTILTRDDILNGNIARDEGYKYISDLKEIKLNLNDLSEIFDMTYDDKMLESIYKKNNGDCDTSNSNLTCTCKDIDDIINLLQQGKNLKIDRDGDIKVSSTEGNQFYNKEYPFFTEYTISCGSYSRTIRIPHK